MNQKGMKFKNDYLYMAIVSGDIEDKQNLGLI